MRTLETTDPRKANRRRFFQAAARWLTQAAILAFVLSTSTGLAANPLRAEEQPPQLATPAEAIPAEISPVEATALARTDTPQADTPPAAPRKMLTSSCRRRIRRRWKSISRSSKFRRSRITTRNSTSSLTPTSFGTIRGWPLMREAGVHKKTIPADELWTPDPLLVDELDVDERGGTTAHVQPDGTVYLNRYYRGSITGSFDLHEFPMDRHDLEVALEATDYETDEVVFAVGEVRAKNSEHVVPHGWKLIDMEASAGESLRQQDSRRILDVSSGSKQPPA